MENKQNFAGIIIPVIVVVILLTVLPIINSMNVECPPCEECPIYNIGNMEVNPDFSSGNYAIDKGDYDYLDSVTIIKDNNLIPENIKKDVDIFGVVGTLESDNGGSAMYDWSIPINNSYTPGDVADPVGIVVVFALKSKVTTINSTDYYPSYYCYSVRYYISTPDDNSPQSIFPEAKIFWDINLLPTSLNVKAPFDPNIFECLGVYYAGQEQNGTTTLNMGGGQAYNSSKTTPTTLTNGNAISSTFITLVDDITWVFGLEEPLIIAQYASFVGGAFIYLPKLTGQSLHIFYGD